MPYRYRSPARGSAGFSMIELLTTISIVGILATTAISNYQTFRERALDSMALADYRNLKTVVLDDALRADRPGRYRIRNIVGPASLPAPLDVARVSENVRLRRAVRRTTRNREVIRIDLEHLDGRTRYRYTSINGVVREQLIRRRR